MNKRGQGINAAMLVAIIAGIIILYILFLPAEERENLLENKTTKDTATSEEDYTVLLSEGAIELDPIKRIDDIDIPNVYLIETINAKEIEKINPFNIRNGWFDKKSKVVQFSIDDIGNVDNVLLSFSAPVRKGILTIKLNDNIIYEYEPTKVNIVIKLEKNMLEDVNKLEFGVSPVGMKFWRTNTYNIEEIKIVGDITDVSKQESQNIFELSDAGYTNLDKASLKFIPYCSNARDVGVLSVFVNNRNVYSAVPVCDDPVKIPVLGTLSSGENKIVFKTGKGSYGIEQIKVDLELKDVRTIAYYFEIDEEDYADILDDKKNVNITIEFVDDNELKKGELNINRHRTTIDQYKPFYSKKISGEVEEGKKTGIWVEEGNNYVELKPKTTLKIVELEAILWEE